MKRTGRREPDSRPALTALAYSDGLTIPVVGRRHRRARRLIVRVKSGQGAVVTMPWRSSIKAANEFVNRHRDWICSQWVATNHARLTIWREGAELLVHGQLTRIERISAGPSVYGRIGPVMCRVDGRDDDLKPRLEPALRMYARSWLMGRLRQHADRHGLKPGAVTVRNQRSRWGSCSSAGTISLNWRLIQAPEATADYVILHELTHLDHLDHSPAFWHALEGRCPDYRDHEQWLKSCESLPGMLPHAQP